MKKVDDKNPGANSRRGRSAGIFLLARVLLVMACLMIYSAPGAAMSAAATIRNDSAAKNGTAKDAGPEGISVLTVVNSGSRRYISLRAPAGEAGPESSTVGTAAVNRVGGGERAGLSSGKILLVIALVGGMVYVAARRTFGYKP